jgi:trk system potassium uptake protein TrkH
MLKFLYLNPLKLGFFLTLGTSFAIVLSASHQLMPTLGTGLEPGLLVSVGLSLLGFLFFIDGRKAQWLMAFGLLSATVVSLFYLYLMPARAYFVLCLLMLSAYLLPGVVTTVRWRPDAFRHDLLKSMLLMTACNWILVQLFRVTADTAAQAWLVFSTWLCLIFSFMDRYYNRLAWRRGSLFLLAGALVIGILPVFLLRTEYLVSASRLSFLGLLACATTFRYQTGLRRRFTKIMEGLFFHPEGVVITFFLWFCIIGTLLLAVPFRGVAGGGIALIDAAFTAVSSVCITGLMVLNLATDFSRVDQVIILILIQIGGLGIMTLSSLALFLMGQRMSVTQEATLASVIGQRKLKSEMRHTLARVLVFTLLVEAVGAVILTLGYLQSGQPWGTAIWKGVFTAISAFCNAGVTLESGNVMLFQEKPLFLHTVAALIIIGGLSPAFVMAIPRLGREGPVPIQYKLVLIATFSLLFGGMFILLGLEWNGSFQDLSVADKIHNAWFHSVTTRTAGFSTVDISSMNQASLYVMMLLMFIGGSPGGTSGGIKTTTFMVLVYTAVNIIRGRQEVQILGRHLRHSTVYRAMTVTFLAASVVILAFLILVMSQPLDSQKLLFEVFAAVGTAGLSLGVTPQLDAFGKAVIMACMFLGRVGPLSVFIFMLEQPTRSRWTLPSEDVVVT